MMQDVELPDILGFSCQDDGYGMTKIAFGVTKERYGWEISKYLNKVYPAVKGDGNGSNCPQY